jgi:hypothetical protein
MITNVNRSNFRHVHGKRASVLDCGSPLPLCVASRAMEKRWRATALQDLADVRLPHSTNHVSP